jgi:hypothetical protein
MPFETRVIIVVYGTIATVVACIIWLFIKTSVPAEREVKTRREELLEAKQRVERQIEIMESTSRVSRRSKSEAVDELRQVLSKINDELEAKLS